MKLGHVVYGVILLPSRDLIKVRDLVSRLLDGTETHAYVDTGAWIRNRFNVAISRALECGAAVTSARFENAFDKDSAVALAKALKVNSSIKMLEIVKAEIGDSEVNELAEALKTHSSLMRLFLFENHIGDLGAIALANILKENTVIHELDLSKNNIGDEGAMALAEALDINSRVQILKLGDNKILRHVKFRLQSNIRLEF
ncbi:hypothetical protein GEMRC1_014010 [Eukaryota sp. GEM-RC1]